MAGTGAKRKKSGNSTVPELADDGSGGAVASRAASMPAGGEAGGATPAGLPFVFSAGTGSPAGGAAAAAAPPAESPAEEAAEAATQRLVEACRAGDAAAVAARLPAVTDVNRPARQGAAAGFAAPPLWWAAETGQAECVRLLLAAGAAIEARPAATGRDTRRCVAPRRERRVFARQARLPRPARFLGLPRGLG